MKASEVLALRAQGMSPAEIADKLHTGQSGYATRGLAKEVHRILADQPRRVRFGADGEGERDAGPTTTKFYNVFKARG